MSDPTMCRGRDADGSQCICIRVTETHLVDDRPVCRSCGHIETAHPIPEPPKKPPGATILRFRDAAMLDSGSLKSSRAEAEAETNVGLRKKRRSDTDTEPPPSKKAKGKERAKDVEKPPKTEGEVVCFGTLVLLVGGVVNGVLRQAKVPNDEEFQDMRGGDLVIYSTPQSKLYVNTSWGNDRVNREVKKHFPKAIRYLESQPFRGDRDVGALQ
ncbi:hypothetical protein DFH06DRAFT_1131213 [Mycena polygramma]|nr:hypothetical protein DFH06DRAFT_1131213 [Mycena polygramma]